MSVIHHIDEYNLVYIGTKKMPTVVSPCGLCVPSGHPVSLGEWPAAAHSRGHRSVPVQGRGPQQNGHRGLLRRAVSQAASLPPFFLPSFQPPADGRVCFTFLTEAATQAKKKKKTGPQEIDCLDLLSMKWPMKKADRLWGACVSYLSPVNRPPRRKETVTTRARFFLSLVPHNSCNNILDAASCTSPGVCLWGPFGRRLEQGPHLGPV